MPDISAELRQRVLQALDAALQDLRQLAAKVKPSPGHLGFQHIQNRLEQSRDAIEGVADRNAIVNQLKRLDDAISKTGASGDLAPAAKRLRSALKTLLAELEPK